MIGKALFVPFIVISFLTGCAYQFGSGERHLPGDYAEVAIPVFKNSTSQVGVETYFTNFLIREFNRSKIAHVVSRDTAPIVIEGNVTSIEYRHGGTTLGNCDPTDPLTGAKCRETNKISIPMNTVLTTEYRVGVTADLKVIRTSDRKVLWTGSVSNERNYTAPQVGTAGINSVNALYNHSARMELIETLAQDMMAEVHDRMTENF